MPEPLTVVCSLWKGWQPIYDHRHVNALGRMVARFLPGARFVCFTDTPAGIKFETHPIPRAPRLPAHHGRNCYWRLWYFSPECAAKFPGQIFNIDLDALILQEFGSLVTDDNFRILRANVCPYNGGFWLHRTGTMPHVWQTLGGPGLRLLRRDRVARRWVGSDQAWMAWKAPGAALYTEADGCHFLMGNKTPREAAAALLDKARILFFPGSPGGKPWSTTFAATYPEVHERYMAWM